MQTGQICRSIQCLVITPVAAFRVGAQAWNAGREVQNALAVTRQAEWLAEQETLYALGQVPGLPSDTTIDESSELVEASVTWPAELSLKAVGDAAEDGDAA